MFAECIPPVIGRIGDGLFETGKIVRFEKNQNGTILGHKHEFAALETAKGHLVVAPGRKAWRPPGAFKIAFQFELLGDRAPMKLHEPDNSDTFVSSPSSATSRF
jgi:hypothetical protein